MVTIWSKISLFSLSHYLILKIKAVLHWVLSEYEGILGSSDCTFRETEGHFNNVCNFGGKTSCFCTAADLCHLCLLQKIMHTRKRHQDMFQDLNRKLQHAEKEKESPTTDSKVSQTLAEPSFARAH